MAIIWRCDKKHKFRTRIEEKEFFVPQCRTCQNPRKPDYGTLVYEEVGAAQVGVTRNQARTIKRSTLWELMNSFLKRVEVKTPYGNVVQGLCVLCVEAAHTATYVCPCTCHEFTIYAKLIEDTLNR